MNLAPEVERNSVNRQSGGTQREQEMNQETNQAVQAIIHAMQQNAAPINLVAALQELSRDDAHVTIHADLMLDLVQAFGDLS